METSPACIEALSPVSFVVVNYRTPELTTCCLGSIADYIGEHAAAKAVVVDNLSNDGSVEKIRCSIARAGWERWASVVVSARNGGFSYGNNAGIAYAIAALPGLEFLMLVNPDALLRPAAVEELLSFMRANPRAGIVGCRIEDPAGRVQRSAHAMLRPVDEWVEAVSLRIVDRWSGRRGTVEYGQAEPRRCGWVSGAAFMMRREAFEAAGGFDEGFFLYFEEIDLCRRVHEAGWEVWHLPSSVAVHAEGASTGITQVRRRRPGYWYASRRRFFVKAYGVGGLLLADVFRLAGRSLFLVRKWLRLGSAGRYDPTPLHFMRDLLWGDAKAWLSGELRAIGRSND